MTNLVTELAAYHKIHRTSFSKWSHYIGVPLLLFALLIFFSWFDFRMINVFEIRLSWILVILLAAYYLKLDWQLGALATVGLIIINFIACLLTYSGINKISFIIFLLALVVVAVLQLMSHFTGGKERPTLRPHLIQIVGIGPLFLAAEGFFAIGYKKDLKQKIT